MTLSDHKCSLCTSSDHFKNSYTIILIRANTIEKETLLKACPVNRACFNEERNVVEA